MCDVMPTISEDSISQRNSQMSGDDANFEQLMVSMLDERDKLMDTLRETQIRLGETETKLQEVEKERDSLHRQLSANLPQVHFTELFTYIDLLGDLLIGDLLSAGKYKRTITLLMYRGSSANSYKKSDRVYFENRESKY